MVLLDKIGIHHNSEERFIELYRGDLTNMPPDVAVDILIVSAFPNRYTAAKGSLIGALERKGVSLAVLAQAKEVDLRKPFSCWLSQKISSPDPGIQFKQILCFEPLVRGRLAEMTGDIFQCLMPIVSGDKSINSVAMPLVASGYQNVPISDIIAPLIDAAVHWLAMGMPIKHLKIVEFSETKAAEIKGAFSILKKKHMHSPLMSRDENSYDVFISYSHANKDEVIFIAQELEHLHSDIRIFLDRKELSPGASWQQEIFEAIDDCKKVIPIFSPSYITSKVCKEEYNIAHFRHRDSEKGVLVPIYLYTAPLPTYMRLIQFIDCREGDRNKISLACNEIVLKINE